MHRHRQLSLHFEALPLKVMHRIVIQAAAGHSIPDRFDLKLHLIKGHAGEHAAADGSKLNHVLSTAGCVVFDGFDPSFPHLSADPLAEAAVQRIPQPGLQGLSLLDQSETIKIRSIP